MKRVAIAGGGISGLTLALQLGDRASDVEGGLEVVVLEARDRLGGNIRTEQVDGYTMEAGPNGFLDNAPATLDLVRRLGLEDRLQPADPRAARRFLYRDGRLHLLPSGPGGLLTTRALSLRGRLRVLGEPLVRRGPEAVDESVHAFASRRIGAEAASVLVDAMVSGVFAGDARQLSLGSAFPRMAAMEAEHGSLIRAMAARRKRRKEDDPAGGPAGPGGTLTSFDEGMSVLVDGLGAALGPAVRTGRPAVGLEQQGGRWRVRLEDGGAVDADAVVLTVPSARAATLLGPVDEGLAAVTGSIPAAGLAVLALGYRVADVGGSAPDGFGFLVPRGQGPRILGCLWSSSIFPGRAPEGHVLFRCMIGGARDDEAVSLDEGELMDVVRRDLRTTMGITGGPRFVRIYRWPAGIPQYTIGHAERLERIQARLRDLPGLHVGGSAYHGVSMNACIASAPAQAERVLQDLIG